MAEPHKAEIAGQLAIWDDQRRRQGGPGRSHVARLR